MDWLQTPDPNTVSLNSSITTTSVPCAIHICVSRSSGTSPCGWRLCLTKFCLKNT